MRALDARQRLPELDGLRAVAALAVLLWHSGLSEIPGGFIGVDVFFVLSGYLITATLLRERERTGGIRLLAFYTRRARRLFPALGVLLIAVAIYSWTNAGESWATSQSLRGLPYVIAYVSNWALTYQWVAGSMGMIGHTWTLAVEEQFYAVWPLALILIIKPTWRYGRIVIGLLALSLVEAGLRAYLFVWGHESGVAKLLAGYYSTLGHSDGLLLGAALAFWLATERRLSAPARANLILGGAAALLVMMATVSAASPIPSEGLRIVVNAATAAMILGIVAGGGGFVCAALRCRPMVYIGRISYSLYLWHYPLFIAIGSIPFFAQYHGWYWAAKLTVPFIVAAGSYQYVEKPFLSTGGTRSKEPLRIGAHSAR